MKWIASTLCKVCIHSWHAVALNFFVDLMFIQWENLRKKLHYFPLTVILKCRKWHLRGTYLKIFPGAACHRISLEAHTCGDHGHGYAGPNTVFFKSETGIFLICPAWWGICRFLRAIKTNPHLYPRVGWVGVYFDWCITISFEIKFSCLKCVANLSRLPILKPPWRRLVKLFETVTPPKDPAKRVTVITMSFTKDCFGIKYDIENQEGWKLLASKSNQLYLWTPDVPNRVTSTDGENKPKLIGPADVCCRVPTSNGLSFTTLLGPGNKVMEKGHLNK